MNFLKLSKIMSKYAIPENVTLMSDSNWECDATHMDGVSYNAEKNLLVFTQWPGDGYYGNKYGPKDGYVECILAEEAPK